MGRPSITGQVFEKLVRGLAGGTWAPGEPLPAVRRLAKQFGVSPRTALHAVHMAAEAGLIEPRNHLPGIVMPGAADRADELLTEISQSRPCRKLAILIPETVFPLAPNTYWHRVSDAICDEARLREFEPEPVSWPLSEQVQFAQTLSVSRYCAAVALSLGPPYLPSVHELERQWFPVVLHNCRVKGMDVPGVMRDDYGAAWRLGELLAQNGHRNMMMFTNIETAHGLKERNRSQGWVDFLRQADLIGSCTHPVYYVGGLHIAEAARVLSKLIGGPDAPTALVLSVSVARYAECGAFDDIRIPEDLSIAVFDAIGWPAMAQPKRLPPLTTVTVDHHRAAQCCLEALEEMLGGTFWPPTIRVPLRIGVTGSIGSPPGLED